LLEKPDSIQHTYNMSFRAFAKLIAARPRALRVEAISTLVIWFVVGAFVGSTVGSYFGFPDLISSLVIGVIALLVAALKKAA
jgi:hypothetical protein